MEIFEIGGLNDKGFVCVEFDIILDFWFFFCYFEGDLVMFGCFGFDVFWQLMGFYFGWFGEFGKGCVFFIGEVKFIGQIMFEMKFVEFGIDFKCVMCGCLVFGIVDGWVKVDGEEVFKVIDLCVGFFKEKIV